MCSLSPISLSLTHTYTLVLGDVKNVCHNYCHQISQLWQLLHAQTQMHAGVSNTFAEYPTRVVHAAQKSPHRQSNSKAVQ